MKKNTAIILTILSAILILDSLNFGHSLMMFYLAGIIPGTSLVIDGARMLDGFLILAGFTLARVSSGIILFATNRETTEKTTRVNA